MLKCLKFKYLIITLLLSKNIYAGFDKIVEVGVIVSVDPYIYSIHKDELRDEMIDLMKGYLPDIKVYNGNDILKLYKYSDESPFLIFINLKGFELMKSGLKIYSIQVSLLILEEDEIGTFEKIYIKINEVENDRVGISKRMSKFVKELSDLYKNDTDYSRNE